MIGGLTIVLCVASLLVALAAAALFAAKRTRPRGLDLLVLILEGGFIVQAMIGVGQIVSGDRHASFTHGAYLVTSVAVLPIALGSLADDRTPWSSAVIAVACLAVAVVAVRLQMTGP